MLELCHGIGVDEVGRGSLAGPVVVGAVIIPEWLKLRILGNLWLDEVDDSKRLGPKKRLQLNELIRKTCPSAVGIGTVEQVNRLGIMGALKIAAGRAVDKLNDRLLTVFVDGNVPLVLGRMQSCVVGGDGKYLEIACASIIAKVTRDLMMAQWDRLHPGYNFSRHKGYGTREHLESIIRLGACGIHRRNFTIQAQGMGQRRKIGDIFSSLRKEEE